VTIKLVVQNLVKGIPKLFSLKVQKTSIATEVNVILNRFCNAFYSLKFKSILSCAALQWYSNLCTQIGSRQCFDLSQCGTYPQLGKKLDMGKQFLTKSEYIEIVRFAESKGVMVHFVIILVFKSLRKICLFFL